MVRRIVGRALVASVVCALVGTPAFARPSITVGKNVLVSAADAARAHYEVLLEADPSNPQRLLACATAAMAQPADALYDTIVYVSEDGGAHWRPTLDARRDSGDPACAYGLHGRAYFAAIATKADARGKHASMTLFYRSDDGGITWHAPVELSRGLDREFIAVDTTDGPRSGTIYVNAAHYVRNINEEWENPADFVNTFGTFVSTDGGRTFTTLMMAPNDGQYVFAQGGSTVANDGTYFAVFPDIIDRRSAPPPYSTKPGAQIKLMSSDDGGQTFSRALTIAQSAPCENDPTFSMLPMVAVDRTSGPFKNRLYATWPDQQSGRCEIKFAYSKDAGKTWSAPITVNDDRPRFGEHKGPDNFIPAVAVNDRGVVGVLWEDRGGDPDNLGYAMRFAASVDGGDSFTPSVVVSDAPARIANAGRTPLWADSSGGGNREDFAKGGNLSVSLGYNGRFDFIGGDTIGLAAGGDGAFHALWVDNRLGAPQVWAAPINVGGAAMRFGSPYLSGMDDVTERVTIDVANVAFDRETQDVTADAYLANTSGKPLKAPIKLRLLRLSSRLGDVALAGADDDGIVTFSGELPNGMLAPNQRSSGKRLTFHLTHLPASLSSAPSGALTQLVKFEARAYAFSAKSSAGK